jgi:arylformamidase
MTPRGAQDLPLIDISILVDEFTPEWPGDTPWTCRWTWDMARGDSVNVSCVNSSPHVGTHADAPFHVDPRWPASDALTLDAFTGVATVADVSRHRGALDVASLGLPAGQSVERLLLRTARSIGDGAFPDSWPWLDDSAVGELLDLGLRLLGVDAPSVDGRDSTSLVVHRALFRGGAFVLENLDLRQVAPGDYHLTAFPLRVAGLDASPVRAVLRPLSAS